MEEKQPVLMIEGAGRASAEILKALADKGITTHVVEGPYSDSISMSFGSLHASIDLGSEPDVDMFHIPNVEVHSSGGQNIDGRTTHAYANGASLGVGSNDNFIDVPEVKAEPENPLWFKGNRKQRRAKESDWRRKNKHKGWF